MIFVIANSYGKLTGNKTSMRIIYLILISFYHSPLTQKGVIC